MVNALCADPRCQRPCIPGQHTIVVIEKGVLHEECLRTSGKSTEEWAEVLNCCNSKEFLRQLVGGTIVQRHPDVPPNECWFAHPTEKRFIRFGIEANGEVVQLSDPPAVHREHAAPVEGDSGSGA